MGRALAIFPLLMTAACSSSPTPAASTKGPISLFPERIAEASATAPPPPSSTEEAPKDTPPAPPIPTGTAVLHIGDSFALSGFAQALRPRMKALGVRYEVRAETSSFTTSWSAKMERVVADTQPDLVIINLGANEVANTDPTTHAPHVRRIVKAIGGRPCVWVSPPLWRQDTGITAVIRENSAPCRFFDTDALVKQPIPRQSDHIHPTPVGGAIWAEAFWSWLGAERAPAEVEKQSPWRLKPSPPEEHQPRL